MTRCPSDLELERLARQPEDPAAGHVFSCARCAARLARMRRLAEEFERDVFPATIEAVVEASERPRFRAAWVVGAAAAAALLVAMGALWAAGGGAPIELLAWAGPDVTVADGQAIPPGAVMRFEVRPRRNCTLWMASADASGNVTRIYPPKTLTGTRGLPVEAGTRVAVDAPPAEGGEHPGPERYFAVCLRENTLHWKDVDRAARSIGPGDAQVRSARRIPGLPGDAVQVSLLVERRQ